MVDKNFCMSSYLTYRYIEREDIYFYEGMSHKNFKPLAKDKCSTVHTSEDIGREIQKVFDAQQGEKLGIMLSGGMDSAILASYMPGCHAYTFRYKDGFQQPEQERAEQYAKQYGLTLHYVDLDWQTMRMHLPVVMKAKGAPVHSIEPQIYQAALQASQDGITKMVVGESADLIFGGMDQLLAKDWEFDEFVERYTFTKPAEVLREPIDVNYLFERFRDGKHIRLLDFMDNVFSIESSSSYLNAFGAAGMPYIDPYAHQTMGSELDLVRVRNGESKYLIRGLFALRYPDIPIPEKIAMPRQVDTYFANWEGPCRPEFLPDLDMKDFSGDQKWQIYCLQEFLNLFDEISA